MTLKYYSVGKTVYELVKNIEKGKIALPDFQREFVWNKDKIILLLSSILSNYFIGAILLARFDKEVWKDFEIKQVHGGPDVDYDKLEYLILDGQQRLTALYLAFNAEQIQIPRRKGIYCYYIDLQKVPEYLDLDNDQFIRIPRDCIEAIHISKVGTNVVSYRYWAEQKRLPIYFLKPERNSELKAFLEEIKQTMHFNRIDSLIKAVEALSELITSEYKIQVIEIEKGAIVEDIIENFERVNIAGVTLDTIDLVISKLVRANVDIWNLLNEFRWLLSLLDNKERIAIRRIVESLVLLNNKQPTKSNLLDIKRDIFDRYKIYLIQASKIIEKQVIPRLGMFNSKVIHYDTMLSTIISVITYAVEKWEKLPKNKFEEKMRNLIELLKIWYFSSFLTERYQKSTDTRMHEDFKAFKEYIDKGKIVEKKRDKKGEKSSIILFNLSQEALKKLDEIKFEEINYYRNKIGKAILQLYASFGALNFENKDIFTWIEYYKLEYHHFFSKEIYGRLNYNIDSVLNIILLDKKSHKKIPNREHPKDYLNKIFDEDKHRLELFLKSHILPEFNVIEEDDPKKFVEERERLVKKALKDILSRIEKYYSKETK